MVTGDTLNVYGDDVIPVTVTGVLPLVYVILHGAVPVNATERVALLPLHIVAVPEITAVGNGLIVTINGADVAEQAPFVTVTV